MKRKLDESDVPREVENGHSQKKASDFGSMGLDSRLLQGIANEKFATPTPIQSLAIPLALEGKDILARAKTGSGKTAAYLLPILQAILRRKTDDASSKQSACLILTPTKELAGQVTNVIASLSACCNGLIRCENLTRKEDDQVQKARLAEQPDIVVATPMRAALLMTAGSLVANNLTHLVVDEADLVLSYGYEHDLRAVALALPKGVQSFFMSATLGEEIDTLKTLFGSEPAVLALDDDDKNSSVSQYMVRCAEDEKFLLAYAIFKLKLIKGKCIIFVADTDRCYRLKLFLEQFAVKSCVLNSELPVNSRIHVVEEFNRNIYDIIIASDEHEVIGDESSKRKKKREKSKDATDKDSQETQPVANEDNQDGNGEHSKGNQEDQATTDTHPEDEDESFPSKKRQKISKQDKEYGVARGIDFKNVACVLNFDLPVSSKSYTHRIGRTARAGKSGMALSFVIPKEQYRKHKTTSTPSTEHDEEVIAKIVRQQEKKGQSVQPYHFDMKKLDGFRYRMSDALHAVTRTAVREARTRELRQELLKSEKLKRHFEENPAELQHLRHDGELHTARVQHHLKHVPDYLLPGKSKQSLLSEGQAFVGLGKTGENRVKRARMHNKLKGRNAKSKGRKMDPLKTFNARGRGKR
ncbi:MAG: ATP-dependent DNA/RNA helicase [Bathelium mastoideum]|nr:MAG: ATP-dependent DNA/RNA helicase [Bathelium mastoideum]